MEFLIRRMKVGDVAISRALLSQLEYEMEAQELRRRYDAVTRSEDHAVMVAEQNGTDQRGLLFLHC